MKRVPVRERRVAERIRDFEEVCLGYDEAETEKEAGRCLGCKDARCIKGCPVQVDIPGFIHLLREGRVDDAYRKIMEQNILAGVCGRVCPQETQCEAYCILSKKQNPISIGKLERFCADFAKEKYIEKEAERKERIAVVGSGPAGIACAFYLIKKGYNVYIFEALHEAGGVLRYGIPPFRLPRHILDEELMQLQNMGCVIHVNFIVGRTKTLLELSKEFDAVFIGTGAGAPLFLGIEQEGAAGVYSANEFLVRVNLMKAYKFPEYDTPIYIKNPVVVIGGGNVALDCARSALRLGGNVTLLYRRTKEFMPARIEEVIHAEEEGVNFLFLTAPKKILVDEDGWIKGIECIKMELGSRDSSGRPEPLPINGSEFFIECGTLIVAIGQGANPTVFEGQNTLKRNKRGYIIVDSELRTNIENVWAGGDIVTGAATVISAMGQGRLAASSIHNFLSI